jgi:hypothetical protein
MFEKTKDDPFHDPEGRKLMPGKFVEVDTADWEGKPDIGQLIECVDEEHGFWSYRGIDAHSGREYTGKTSSIEVRVIKHQSKQTDAARATRRKLRAMGFRTKRSWSDGLVQMERPDGIYITVALDGRIKQPTSEQCFQALIEMLNAGFELSTNKGHY